MNDRTTHAAAKLVLMHSLFRQMRAELEGIGVECSVAQKLKSCPVKLIGSGFGDDIHNATCRAARFCCIAVALDSNLLNGIDGRTDADGADDPLVVVHAVYHLVGNHFGLAVDGYGGGDAPVVRASAAVQPVLRSFVRPRS